MFEAIAVSTTEIAFNKDALTQSLIDLKGHTDIFLLTPDIYNPLIIPFIAWVYTYCLHKFPKVDVTICYKTEDVQILENFTKITLDPFEASPVEIVCFGGSFDRMHYGHKLLITTGVLLCKKYLIIGVSRNIGKKAHHEMIQPFHDRVSTCMNLVYKLNQDLIVRTEVIDDVAGPTGYLPDIDLLVLSQETIKGGDAVNQIREGKGLKPLHYVAVPLVKMVTGERLSSSYLRELELSQDHHE
ncbi:Cytidylyltransferase family protein [Tritrichomonas foetus]|uniref:Cytidylyltransferase family protein n=1 Tax=Tritrichomonas foetus TaxID=1144522 RepID=A0A1J4K1P3_9EUKA|nr:Cytidylyltransferase family protein [Tritrichomonas foetus]|eukprot:OHT03660.1 Cytidylyltransferase family protein [Tritrichomonas foetus]